MNKIGFVTCVELGQACLSALVDEGIQVDLVITLPDQAAKAKSGRVYVDDFCNSHDIELLKSPNINDNAVIEAVQKHSIDWLFVIGWSQIVREELLNTPRLGVIGIHPTLLPQGRGRAAIPWAIIKGLKRTGVTMFKIDSGVDTGPILDQIEIALDENTTATTLYEQVNESHETLIRRNAARIMRGEIDAKVQDESLASEWPGRKPSDGDLTQCKTAEEALRLVRATTHPYPGAFFEQDNQRIIIWSAKLLPIGSAASEHSLAFEDGILSPIETTVDSNK